MLFFENVIQFICFNEVIHVVLRCCILSFWCFSLVILKIYLQIQGKTLRNKSAFKNCRHECVVSPIAFPLRSCLPRFRLHPFGLTKFWALSLTAPLVKVHSSLISIPRSLHKREPKTFKKSSEFVSFSWLRSDSGLSTFRVFFIFC